MTKGSTKRLNTNLILVLTILVVFACSLVFTGTWFTDKQNMRGDLDTPTLNPIIVDADGKEISSLEYNSSTTSQKVYIKIASDTNNVNYQLLRIIVHAEWGTGSGANFVADENLANNGALTPNYTSSWTKGSISLTTAYVAESLGMTESELTALIESSGMTLAEFASSMGVSNSNSPTYYYYNDIIKVKSLTSNILAFDGFTLNGGSEYTGKTAKITITVESASVSDKTLGGTENGATFDGMWTKTDDDGHKAPDAWVASIKSQRKNLV